MIVIILYCIVLALQLAFACFILYLVIAFITGAPFVPSTNPTASQMIALAQIKKGDTVIDLGSGDAKLLFLAARGGATAIGYEINPFLVLYSNLKTRFSPYRHTVKTVWKNFWRADVSQADVVFIYLLPWKMNKLAEILTRQLKPGTRVVSNSFIFPDWKILRQDKVLHVYVFRIPD